MRIGEFIRLFEVRAPKIMWFLGAGASVSAGVPSAWDLIWQFKQKIYCSEQRIPIGRVADLSNSAVRSSIQRYFDGKGGFPKEGDNEEYAAFFEATYPSERDRRAFLDPFLMSKEPSYGHHVLAYLMRSDKTRVIWTTNFDKLIEEASARAFGSVGNLLTADLGEPEKVALAFNESKWPLLVKLHGDFHSDRLKNTRTELQSQDAKMRGHLLDACQHNGLAVVGYSGRDESIMDVLEEVVSTEKGFPNGLFWFTREKEPLPRVSRLIKNASEGGIEASLIEVTTFDELTSDIARFLPGLDHAALEKLSPERNRLTVPKPPSPSRFRPYIRTNAVPLTHMPTTCRLIECDIGGFEEVQAALVAAGVDAVAQRTKAGVIAFGKDEELKQAFSPFNIRRLDYFLISPDSLSRPSAESRLLYDALQRAMTRLKGVTPSRKRSSFALLVKPDEIGPAIFNTNGLKAVDSLSGLVKGTSIRWVEGVGLQLDYQAGRAWMLLKPRSFLQDVDEADQVAFAKAKDFIRERAAVRRNRENAAILDGWIQIIFGESKSLELRAFGIADGSDASFHLSRVTGFAGRS
jgi:hypothetical protein